MELALDQVMVSVMAQINRNAVIDLPSFRIGDEDRSTLEPYVAFLPPEGTYMELTGDQYTADMSLFIIVMHNTRLMANQLSHEITKYILQDRSLVQLVDEEGNQQGYKHIKSVVSREMVSNNPNLFGMALEIEYRGGAGFIKKSSTVVDGLFISQNKQTQE